MPAHKPTHSASHRSATSAQHQATLSKLQELIAEFIIDEAGNILPHLELEDDLGIDFEITLPKLIAKINEAFEIHLNSRHLIEDFADASLTIADLVTIISDESELG